MLPNPLIFRGIRFYHLTKAMGSVWLKPHLWTAMKNALRNPVYSLLEFSMQQEPSWLLQEAVPGQQARKLPNSALCLPQPAPAAPQLHGGHCVRVTWAMSPQQINRLLLQPQIWQGILRGYQTFALHRSNSVVLFVWTKIYRKNLLPEHPASSSVPWRASCAMTN